MSAEWDLMIERLQEADAKAYAGVKKQIEEAGGRAVLHFEFGKDDEGMALFWNYELADSPPTVV